MAAPNTPPSTGKGLASPSRPFRLGHPVKVGARLAQALLVSKCNQQYRMSQSATCNVTLHHPVVSQWDVLCSTGTHCQEQKENIVSYFQLLHLCVALLRFRVPGLPRQAVPTLAGRGGAVDAALGTGTCHHWLLQLLLELVPLCRVGHRLGTAGTPRGAWPLIY